MTPHERAARDAWLSEMWPTVREYHDGDPLPKRPAKRRPRRPGGNVDNAVDDAESGAA